MHGIGGRSADANAELKITDVCSMIKLHDIAVLTETRTSDAGCYSTCLALLCTTLSYIKEMKARMGMESLCSLPQAALTMCVC